MDLKSRDTDSHLDYLGFFQEDFMVCDLGCGVGYIPNYTMKNKKKIQYLGIDVISNKINYCRNRFRQGNYRFKRLNLYSETYNPTGSMRAEFMKIPLPDGSVDSVICHSLFTHLDNEEVAKRYISEILRIMKAGGKLWITFFTDPPNKEGGGTMRTVYKLSFIETLLAGFEEIHDRCGATTEYHDQLEISCVKR